VTDRGIAYASLSNLSVGKPDSYDGELEQIVSLNLSTLNLSEIPLNKLIAFREREARESGHNLTALRHRYLQKLEEHISLMVDTRGDSRDREELERQFAEDSQRDIRDLRSEMHLARSDAILSSTLFATVAAAAGTVALAAVGAPIHIPDVFSATGGFVTIGGAFASGVNRFARSRRQIMRGNPMAYLYELEVAERGGI
jgi:hypothetical protein